MQNQFPKFKAASVQAAPVYLNREATTDKACSFIQEAANNGAKIIAFPETFIPGYPHWVWLDSPGEGDRFFSQFVRNSLAVPSPTVEKLCQVAREHDIYVAIGIDESSPYSFAEIFNTMLLLDPNGKILGKHRKIMPTYAEKLVWSFGDGSSLRVYDTQLGRIGMLICGENTNSLARFALIAQGEQMHISSYPAFPQKKRYDLKKAIEIRAAGHSFEGKVFNIVSSSLIDKEMKCLLGDTPEKREVLNNSGNGFTGIIGPNGEVVAGPLPDGEEGIVYGDINLEECLQWKLFHDISGNYNRFDILSLNLNREIRRPIREVRINRGRERFDSDVLERLKEKVNEIENDTLRTELLNLIEFLPSVTT
jgi:aliphatic nitrilase